MSICDVLWSEFLGPDSLIPHDVVLESRESHVKRDVSVLAHKFVLAAVSDAFRKIFYANTQFSPQIPVQRLFKKETKSQITKVQLPNTTIEAAQAMLDFIYGRELQFPLEDLEQLPHVFDTLKLAQHYEIHKLEELLKSKIALFPLSPSNVRDVLECASMYAELCMSSNSLLFRCLTLSYNQVILTKLVEVGKQSFNSALVAGALTRLRCRVTDQNLWDLARLGDVDEVCIDNDIVSEAARGLVTRCLERLSELMRFPKKFARTTSELGVEDDKTYKKMMRLLEKMFCENCESVSCKDGRVIEEEEVKEGIKVNTDEGLKGIIVGTLEPRKKIKLEVDVGNEGSPITSSYREKFCLKLRLDNGTEVDSVNEVYFDCNLSVV